MIDEPPIASPPWTLLGKGMESQFRKALLEFKLLEGVNKVTVALSGGKDSLTLLYMLHAVSGRGFPKLEIHAAHVRGELSCGASIALSALQAICDRLNVSLHVRQSQQTLQGLECYRCSRERRKLLFEMAKEADAPTVAFGHHKDDSIQTLLMNLLVKGEFAANLPKVPMHKYGVTIIRPLLLIPENDIRKFAQHYGFARITCQCPVGQNSKRKQAEKLLTLLEEQFPQARHNLSLAALRSGSDKALRL